MQQIQPQIGPILGRVPGAERPWMSFDALERTLEAQKSGVQRLGMTLLLVYVFAIFGLLTELSDAVLGVKPYVTIVVGPILIVLAAISGNALRLLKSKIGIAVALLCLWLVFLVPFSTWRGGAFESVKDALLKSYALAVMIPAFVLSVKDLRRILFVGAVCDCLIYFISIRYGMVDRDGRFVMSFGSLKNPNDFASHLLVLLPFVLFMILSAKRSTLKKVALGILAGLILFVVVKTSSRAAILATGVMGLVLLKRASSIQRLAATSGLLAVMGISAITNPQVWTRFSTTFSDSVKDQSYGVESRKARTEMFWRTLNVAVHHPLFGVGPGGGASYMAGEDKASGKRASWLGSHNTYTELAMETGFIGLILFGMGIFYSLRIAFVVQREARGRPELVEISQMAYVLAIGWSGFAVNLFFAHLAYDYYPPFLFGLTIALELLARQALALPASGSRSAGLPPAPPVPRVVGPARLRPEYLHPSSAGAPIARG
jgi:O-antigen ligase